MILILGGKTGQPLSLGGRYLVHDGSAEELAFLMPTVRHARIPASTAEEASAKLGVPVMLLREHPNLTGITWPLDRRQFRGQG